MNAQVYSVPGQTEGTRKPFFEWKSINPTYGVNVNYYKSVHHPISCENREHPGNFQNKSVSSAFN